MSKSFDLNVDELAAGLELNKKRKTINPREIVLFRTPVLRALGDETRQRIILLLGRHGPLCVNDIAAHFNLGRPTISHHLKLLKEARIARHEKSGKEVYYSLNSAYILRAMNGLQKVVGSITPSADNNQGHEDH
jgi:DNA-binding transcriptional ArsR family regulator